MIIKMSDPDMLSKTGRDGVLDMGKEELINRGIREEYIEVYIEAYRNY